MSPSRTLLLVWSVIGWIPLEPNIKQTTGKPMLPVSTMKQLNDAAGSEGLELADAARVDHEMVKSTN
ncbi:hypothetical protein M5K25_026251 [Dendrobium thyrsiflorum]|uniref:Uncharacterized protein n=1 Tax=Dendrobium thyrsiflorum TaxID=117978 RepID=A0ABD0TWU4_DENTH